RIARTGAGIVISPVVVESLSAPIAAREVWQHQLRWARTIRVCQPAAYFFSILNNVSFWSLLWVMSGPPTMPRVVLSCLPFLVRCNLASTAETKMTKYLDPMTTCVALVCDFLRPLIWVL